ncbi:conserved hypothetical protein [Vibrio coralliirubri]|uniref:Uncharacterized protein n=1 Tax=Vibrio coralliirubri TaxID=1516159 RepID=A0AA86WV97_9VIBR|nr:conserved hypothetical protein [Vibrio coralliirubri]
MVAVLLRSDTGAGAANAVFAALASNESKMTRFVLLNMRQFLNYIIY